MKRAALMACAGVIWEVDAPRARLHKGLFLLKNPAFFGS
jgi:hypothetical protein